MFGRARPFQLEGDWTNILYVTFKTANQIFFFFSLYVGPTPGFLFVWGGGARHLRLVTVFN